MLYNVDIQAGAQSIFKSTEKEVYDEVKKCAKSKGTLSPFTATLVPVRTNNLKNFAKDLFFPTIANQVPRINSVAGKIFAGLGALILDLMTFPVRLLTSVPRVLASSKAKNHALYKFLVKNGVAIKNINVDTLKVNLEGEASQGVIEIDENFIPVMPIDTVTENLDVDLVTKPAKKIVKGISQREFFAKRKIRSDRIPRLSEVEADIYLNVEKLRKIQSELLNFQDGRSTYNIIEAKAVVLLREGKKVTPFSMVVRDEKVDKYAIDHFHIKFALKKCFKKVYDEYDLTNKKLAVTAHLFVSYAFDEDKRKIYAKSISSDSENSEVSAFTNCDRKGWVAEFIGSEGLFKVDS
ncbi:MAG: hypothetical protein VX777_08960 [Chlamydiota bacterium]|nr:hypothetical protein [Chlamydiota bacterium]